MSSNEDSSTDPDSTVKHEYGSETLPLVAVIDAVAALEDLDPTAVDSELGIVLYDYLDPKALNSLFESSGATDVKVSFEIESDTTYSVTITADQVTITRNAQQKRS